jgi:hypothetical protein
MFATATRFIGNPPLSIPPYSSVQRRWGADCDCRSTRMLRAIGHNRWQTVSLRIMTGSFSCRVEQLSSAKPAVVYDVLMNVEHCQNGCQRYLPRHGSGGEPDTGVGGIRRIRTGIRVTRDRVIGKTRPHHHAYADGNGHDNAYATMPFDVTRHKIKYRQICCGTRELILEIPCRRAPHPEMSEGSGVFVCPEGFAGQSTMIKAEGVSDS